MIYIAAIIGALAGSVLTFIFVSILVRQGQSVARQQIADNNDRSIDLLAERNRISQRQLEVLEKGAITLGPVELALLADKLKLLDGKGDVSL